MPVVYARIADVEDARIRTIRISRHDHSEADDVVAVEEPLEIRVAQRRHGVHDVKPVSVTMRTPGDDFDLALGFLFTEGILKSIDDLESIRHWGSANVVRVALRDGATVDLQKLQRHFYATSSCGVCGKSSIDALRVHASPIPARPPIDAALIHRLPSLLRATQNAFDATGGLHAAAIVTLEGELLVAREDVGRHNAVDKTIGAMLAARALPLARHVLVVSSRASFELVQKAVVAGIPILAAVGAPSSLAIELAKEMGMTLLGFVREGRYNTYS
jgi:FdhD protein